MALIAGVFRSEYIGEDPDTGLPMFDRALSEEYWQHYLGEFTSNGVFPNGFVATPNNNLTVTLSAGSIYMDNIYGYTNEPEHFQFTVPQSGYKTCRVVIHKNKTTRSADFLIKESVVSTTIYNPPAIDRNEDVFEMALFDVNLRAGQTIISAADITDLRMNNSVCGMIFNPLQEIDTTHLYDQVQGDLADFKATEQKTFAHWSSERRQEYESWTSEQKLAYLEWLASLKDALEEDAAGKLWLAIESLKEEVKKIEPKVSSKLDKTEGGTVTGATNFTGTLQNGGNSVLSTNSDGRVYQGSNATPNLNVYGKLQKSGVNVQTQAFGKESITSYLTGTFRPWNGEGHRFAVSKYGNIVNMHIQLDVLYNLPVTVHPITSRPIPEKYRPYGEPNAVVSVVNSAGEPVAFARIQILPNGEIHILPNITITAGYFIFGSIVYATDNFDL